MWLLSVVSSAGQSVGGGAGDVVMVSGHVVDGVSGESVAFASCADVGSGRGAGGLSGQFGCVFADV